jgi:hypothetical protein
MAQIGAMFGVTEMTISNDLRDSKTTLELKPPILTSCQN